MKLSNTQCATVIFFFSLSLSSILRWGRWEGSTDGEVNITSARTQPELRRMKRKEKKASRVEDVRFTIDTTIHNKTKTYKEAEYYKKLNI